MKIEKVDLFYLAMPEIRDIGDGSQDALLIRVRSGDLVGWGECEASPLVSIANWVCPMSHSACKPVRDTVLGAEINSPADIIQLGHTVRANGLDIAQTAHTWSGIEIALWDLLGKQREVPVYKLLGYEQAFPKTPYASQLFGDTSEQTYNKAVATRKSGYRAVKFGWGVYGRTTPETDRDHVAAAREGIGVDGILMIDAGTVWCDDVDAAALRAAALEENKVYWFEEPFIGEALQAYRELADRYPKIHLAGGEGACSFHAARHLIDFGGIRFVQIDTGRIGGIGPAKAVADYASKHHITYVNHTFTTHLALSASLAPYFGVEAAEICEYPVEASDLAMQLTSNKMEMVEGLIHASERPGLGMDVNIETVRKYAVDVRIQVGDKELFGPKNA
jgi:L-alanine-DL-glutamate epimerase-like enolase superfamily enzyme